MARKQKRDPSEILNSISEKAALVKEAAVILNDSIEAFQSYLATIRGRTEAVCFGSHPDDTAGEESLLLKFHKDGSNWQISWARVVDPDQDYTLKPLLDAPLRIKIAATRLLPELFENIEDRQQELIHEVTEAAAELDAFCKRLPRQEGK